MEEETIMEELAMEGRLKIHLVATEHQEMAQESAVVLRDPG